MKNLNKKIIILLSTILMIVVGNVSVFADDQDSLKFDVRAELPSNQINDKASFFHLNVKPDTKQTVYVVLTNKSEDNVVIETDFNIAKTNSNGLLTYDGEQGLSPNDSLQVNIEKLITVDKEVEIPAKSQIKFPIHLNMDNNKFTGILLGGISFTEKNTKESEGAMSQRYIYTIGFTLTQEGTSDLPTSETLELANAEAKLLEGRKVIEVMLDNREPQIMRNLNISTTVKNMKTDELIFDKRVDKFSIAPNGTLPIILDWGRKDMVPGKYLVEIDADNEDKEWHFEYEFEIEKDEATVINEESYMQVFYPSWTMTFSIIAGILTMANTIYLVKRKNKRD